MLIAHGVGRVYESPLPVWLYLVGAAATVLISFVVRALAGRAKGASRVKAIGGRSLASALVGFGRATAVLVLVAITVLAVIEPEPGLTPVPLLFWVVLIVGTIAVCALIAGLWNRIDPWTLLTAALGSSERDEEGLRDAPDWVGPVLLYALFWFELVSGRGFDPLAILIVVTAYTAFVVTYRNAWRDWELADPLAILFGFAGRTAPLELTDRGILYRGPLAGLDEDRVMPPSLFASVLVLLASTTLDNVRETVEWSSFLRATGLDSVNRMVVDTIALAAMTLPFLLLFLGAIAIAHRWLSARPRLEVARRFGWSLIPIGIAYVLAHNLPLLMTGLPQLASQMMDVAGIDFLDRYAPSPQLVWFIEVVVIVGGHVLGVLAAHRTAESLAPSRRAALWGHAPPTVLMSVFTVTTLWLLSLPLVTHD